MKKEKNFGYKFVRNFLGPVWSFYYNAKVVGQENIPEDGAIIFAGNHRHAFDPVVVMTHTKRFVHYMAKESLFKGFHGFLFKQIGLIKVYRTRNNPEAIESAVELLKNGGTLGIFPEGTRNRTNEELLKFKHGAVTIAKQSGSKIVPFAIKGEYKVFSNKLIIEFGKPIDVSNMETEKANDYIRNEVLKLLRK